MVGSRSEQRLVKRNSKATKRAMLQADDDLKDSTRYTSRWEADKHERQLKDGNEAEACEDAGC